MAVLIDFVIKQSQKSIYIGWDSSRLVTTRVEAVIVLQLIGRALNNIRHGLCTDGKVNSPADPVIRLWVCSHSG